MSDTDKDKTLKENQEKSVPELFEELKKDLTFLPDIDAAKEGFLFALKFFLLC